MEEKEPTAKVRRRARNLPAGAIRLPDHPDRDGRPAGTYYLHLEAPTIEELPTYSYWSTAQATTATVVDFGGEDGPETVGAYDLDAAGNVVPGSARGVVPDEVLAAQGVLAP